MTQKLHGEDCRKRIEQALDGDEAGRELRRKNTERENQRIAEKMERDPGKTGDETAVQEPEEAEAPEAAHGVSVNRSEEAWSRRCAKEFHKLRH